MYVKHRGVSSLNTEVHFSITRLDNGTFIASILETKSHGINGTGSGLRDYDDEGALIYVCAVIFIYAFSIILMIGSLIKKNMQDHGVSKYMKDIDKLRQLERRQEKFKTRMAIQKRFRKIWGSDRGFGGSNRSEGHSMVGTCDSLASVFTDVTPNNKEPLTHDRSTTLSLPLQLSPAINSADSDKSHQRSHSCGADVEKEQNILVEGGKENSRKHGSSSPTVLQQTSQPGRDIPEVTVDLCEKGTVDKHSKLLDTSVVSAFVLPTPPANVEQNQPCSPKLDMFGRKMSSSSLVQLQPLLEADEEAIIV